MDFNNLLFRSVFAHSTLTHNGEFTGGLYGVIDMLASTVNRYSIDRVLICHDTKPYFREEEFPEYKADRKKLDEEAMKKVEVSRKLITDFFSDFRFSSAHQPGYEADDFIGHHCRRGGKRCSHIFIMSNDSDFYQLLTGRVFLCKNTGLYGLKDFIRDYPGLTPKQWPRCIALKGSHNGVPGIKGVGDVTAYKVVSNNITDKEIFGRWKVKKRTTKLRTALATFPYPLVPEPPIIPARKIRYNAADFQELCDTYGMKFRDPFHKAFMRLAG